MTLAVERDVKQQINKSDFSDIDPMSYVTSNYGQSGGGSILESLVPKSLSQQQIFRLFDVAPGLQNINQDNITGILN